MTGLEFRAKALLLGLKTQSAIAKALGVSERTIGTVCNSKRVTKLYEYAILGYETEKGEE